MRLKLASTFPVADMFLAERTERFWPWCVKCPSPQLTGPFCTSATSPGSCWFVDVVALWLQQFCSPPVALCSSVSVLLLNIVLFSISTMHNLHPVASNIDQRDGAERSGGLLLILKPLYPFTNVHGCFAPRRNVPMLRRKQNSLCCPFFPGVL